jgi:RHS repeat-associated protein
LLCPSFGSLISNRSWSDASREYRYGFNGKEEDKEGMGGGGSTYDYGFRIYNSNLGKFLSLDPISKIYPYYSPFQFSGNMPIWASDIDGLEPKIDITTDENGKIIKIKISYTLYVVSKSKEKSSEDLITDFDMSNIQSYFPNVTIDDVDIEFDIKVVPCENMKEARRAKRKNGGYGEFAIYKSKNKLKRSEHGSPGTLDRYKIYLGYGEDNKFASAGFVAHEIGHGLGYDERYVDPVDYNNKNVMTDENGNENDIKEKSLALEGYTDDLMGSCSYPLNNNSLKRLVSSVKKKYEKDKKKSYISPPVDLKEDDWYKEFEGKTIYLYKLKLDPSTKKLIPEGTKYKVKVNKSR